MTLLNYKNFLLATRDSGYKNFSSAIAELVDNSFEANASKVEIQFIKLSNDFAVSVLDNGDGMNRQTMRLALQFGGSTRFNSRIANGRYGMGLPNSSLSQARRVDVYTWQKKKEILHTFLDLDRMISSDSSSIPPPQKAQRSAIEDSLKSKSGTLVKWSNCDRLKFKRESSILKEMFSELGRMFREKLWEGSEILINGSKVEPIDPLFLRPNKIFIGSSPFGTPLSYNLRISEQLAIQKKAAIIKVRFVELPIEKWHFLSNQEKSKFGITKKAGVSILRSGREIEYGWHFMGSKRKENYDDWWRCEIYFEPELDEFFGVTHTKQGIFPSEDLINILSPDIENIARQLNRRVRDKFIKIKSCAVKKDSEKAAELNDHLLPQRLKQISFQISKHKPNNRLKNKGYEYKILSKKLDNFYYYNPELKKKNLTVFINEHHSFFTKIYSKFSDQFSLVKVKEVKAILELLIFAAARSEFELPAEDQKIVRRFRENWSENLTNYLQ